MCSFVGIDQDKTLQINSFCSTNGVKYNIKQLIITSSFIDIALYNKNASAREQIQKEGNNEISKTQKRLKVLQKQ